jgi:hypothetical protein
MVYVLERVIQSSLYLLVRARLMSIRICIRVTSVMTDLVSIDHNAFRKIAGYQLTAAFERFAGTCTRS